MGAAGLLDAGRRITSLVLKIYCSVKRREKKKRHDKLTLCCYRFLLQSRIGKQGIGRGHTHTHTCINTHIPYMVIPVVSQTHCNSSSNRLPLRCCRAYWLLEKGSVSLPGG